MSWQDDPVVAPSQDKPAWMSDPVVSQQPQSPQFPGADPWNHTIGPDTQPYASTPQPPGPVAGAFKGASRALENNLPGADRAVSSLGAVLPQGYGGTGQDYATNLTAEKTKDQQFQTDNPWTNAAGGLAASAPLIAATGGLGGTSPLLARALAQGGVGALAGSVQGASSSPDLTDNADTSARILGGAGIGGGLAGATTFGLGGIGKAFGAFRGVPEGPVTAANIGDLKNAAYKAVDDLEASYTPQAYGGMVNGIADNAKNLQINPQIHPKAAAFIADMQSRAAAAEASGTPITLTQLDQSRQALGRGPTGSSDPGEVFHGMQIRNGIDNFIANAGPEDMASGGGQDAATAIKNARDLAQRQFKLDELSGNLDTQTRQAARTGTGGNLDNKTRAAMDMAINGNTSWTPDETAGLTKGVMGAPGQNVLRSLGRLSPVGNALNASLELGPGVAGVAMGHPAVAGAFAVPAAVGVASKFAADRMSAANVRNVIATILNGGTPPRAPPPSPLAAMLGQASGSLGVGAIQPSSGVRAGGRR